MDPLHRPDDPFVGLSPVALELRVHGVYNTPPTSMLGIPQSDLAQVAGDAVTGFYRSRSGLLPYRQPVAGLAVEAYSWGALTSGARGVLGWVQRALWLLLLPFALVNMAYWARLGLGRGRRDSRLGASAVRVASLLLTVFFVVSTATVFVDLVGWQCYRGGSPACPGLPSYVDWLGRRTSGQRLAIGALGPLLVLMVLVLLANKTLRRYEARPDPSRERLASGGPAGAENQVLLHPDLFNGAARTRVLRDAHVAAGMSALVVFVGAHVLQVWQGGPAARAVVGVLVALAVGVLVLAVLVCASTLPGDVERQLFGRDDDDPSGWRRRAHALVWSAGVLVLVLLAVLLAAPADGFDELEDYAGRNAWFIVLFVALTALHLCVFSGGRLAGWQRVAVPVAVALALVAGCVTVYWPTWRGGPGPSGARVAIVLLVMLAVFAVLAGWHYALARDTRVHVEEEAAGLGAAGDRDRQLARSAFAGAGASVVLAASAWTALLFTTAAVIGAANLLNGSASVTTLETALPRAEVGMGPAPLVVPQVMVWAPLAQVLWLALVAVAVAACVLRFGPARRAIEATADADSAVPGGDLPGVRAARGNAALARRAERILDVIGFVTSPVALALILASSMGQAPWEAIGHIRPLADASLYVVLGTAALLVLLASRLRSSDSARRAVGVLWDLTTFWPRAAHPLAPPCYTERVVPEISRRVLWAHEVSGDRAVVLSGHSQGSLVVAVVAARLESLDRIRILTYGSQVRSLYGRFFPSVFGPEVVGNVPTIGPARLGRPEPDLPTAVAAVPGAPVTSIRGRLDDLADWVNLFRRTDPLGFRVFSDLDSPVDVPTLEVPRSSMGDPGPPVKGHSDYQHSPEYRETIARWTGEPVIGYPTSTVDVRPLPPP